MEIVQLSFYILLLILWLPAIVVIIQLLIGSFARWFKRTSMEEPSLKNERPSIAVLMPAHNEALIIEDTLSQLLPFLNVEDRIILVADNCSDDTAKLAGAYKQVQVVERFNDQDIGKGFALDYGVKTISSDPTDVVVIFDADCRISVNDASSDPLGDLAKLCCESNRPIQSLYLMKSPKGAGAAVSLAEFAWKVKNLVRPLGYKLLNMPCQLMGSGMVFKWEDIANIKLASGDIVEDLSMGLQLAKKGKYPLLSTIVEVESDFPSTQEASNTQKTRWEHGHLKTIISTFPVILKEAVIKKDIRLLSLALDLSVPPLALLVIISLGVFFLSLILLYFGLISEPVFWTNFSIFVLFSLSTLISWFSWGRNTISFKQLLLIPVYIIQKIPFYIMSIFKMETKWVKTDRRGSDHA